jgi:hypothetical protein
MLQRHFKDKEQERRQREAEQRSSNRFPFKIVGTLRMR